MRRGQEEAEVECEIKITNQIKEEKVIAEGGRKRKNGRN
jgi:hypothetical protein